VKALAHTIASQIVDRLREYLSDVPFCSLAADDHRPELSRAEIDWIGRVRVGENETFLIVETKGNGQPRIARNAVNSLLRLRSEGPGAYCIFGAPYISPEAADIATQAGVG